ncbi:MAG: YggW family oxidoreductase [Nevskiales bacterium]|nr:YggW family oxidoreductase [Nevskiales bacterium]
MTARPLGLYVHLPWCVAKCPYCDFNSHGLNGRRVDESGYTQALLRDLDFEQAAAQPGRPLTSIFFGGGTPSLFSADAIGQVLTRAEQRFGFADDIEITLEANPGASDASRFAGYRAAGVNRLSIGIQSFDNAQLRRLGRVHDADAARAAVADARAAGFDNLNVDVMFALPEQSLAQALVDLDAAIALQPEHLSWYQLTLEPGTAFARRPPPLPAEDTAVAIWEQGQARLAEAGFEQYEVSAYARAGRRCRHNLTYWQFEEYLGVGAGAHGMVGLQRRARVRRPGGFIRSAGSADVLDDSRYIEPQDRPMEFLMNALRLNNGFTVEQFRLATGLDVAALEPGLARALALGTLEQIDDRIRPTALGRRHLDDVLAGF